MIDVYLESIRATVALPDAFDGGGEGGVHDHPTDRGRVIKILKDGTDSTLCKMNRMVDIGLPPVPAEIGTIAWPLSRVLDREGGQLIGYEMERARGCPLAEVINRTSRPIHSQPYQVRLRMARNIAKAVAELHLAGIVLGDGLNDTNILASRRGLAFIDVDSWQLRDGDDVYRCEVGTEWHTAPELIGVDLAVTTRHEQHDSWSIGVLTFELLTGDHPFAAVLNCPRGASQGVPLSPKLMERICQGLWAYGKRARPLGVRPKPGLSLDLLHPDVLALMVSTFDRPGFDHPTARPSAENWLRALDAAAADADFLSRIGDIEAQAARERANAAAILPRAKAPVRHWRVPLRGVIPWRRVAAIAATVFIAFGAYSLATRPPEVKLRVKRTGDALLPTPALYQEVSKAAAEISRSPCSTESNNAVPALYRRLVRPAKVVFDDQFSQSPNTFQEVLP